MIFNILINNSTCVLFNNRNEQLLITVTICCIVVKPRSFVSGSIIYTQINYAILESLLSQYLSTDNFKLWYW